MRTWVSLEFASRALAIEGYWISNGDLNTTLPNGLFVVGDSFLNHQPGWSPCQMSRHGVQTICLFSQRSCVDSESSSSLHCVSSASLSPLHRLLRVSQPFIPHTKRPVHRPRPFGSVCHFSQPSHCTRACTRSLLWPLLSWAALVLVSKRAVRVTESNNTGEEGGSGEEGVSGT